MAMHSLASCIACDRNNLTHPDMVLLLHALRVTRMAGRGAASCAGPATPRPCPPCPPRGPPPCRTPHSPETRATREVCCPPRPVVPPPCVPVTTSRTCGDLHFSVSDSHSRSRNVHSAEDRCESNRNPGAQDVVAQRLKRAEEHRRLDYEHEVRLDAAERPAPCAPPLTPYTLGEGREIARATDGRLYELPRTSEPRPFCSSDGEPSRPQRLALESQRSCQFDDRPDPCSHRPLVFVEIDRGAAPHRHALSVTTADGGSICPRPSTAGPAAVSGSARGKAAWCSDPPSFPSVPQPCRPASVVERLRSHSASRRLKPTDERCLHTTASTRATSIERAGGNSSFERATKRSGNGSYGCFGVREPNETTKDIRVSWS